MARKFLDKKTHRFYFVTDDGQDESYVLIFGDEINTLSGAAPSGSNFRRVEYRGRVGEWKPPPLMDKPSLEMYFLPAGSGRFVGLRQRAAPVAGRHDDRRPRAQGDHAGQQERLLLRARPRDRSVHLGPAVFLHHLGERHRAGNRPPDHQPHVLEPATGLVYLPTSTSSSITLEVDPNFEYQPGRSNTGLLRRGRGGRGGRGGAPEAAADAEPRPEPLVPPAIGPEPEEGVRGVLVAWDPVTQTERWRAEGGGSIGGGTVSTAGNLVVQVIPDGRLVAYRADDGEKLLEIETGLRGGMGPPDHLPGRRPAVPLAHGRPGRRDQSASWRGRRERRRGRRRRPRPGRPGRGGVREPGAQAADFRARRHGDDSGRLRRAMT